MVDVTKLFPDTHDAGEQIDERVAAALKPTTFTDMPSDGDDRVQVVVDDEGNVIAELVPEDEPSGWTCDQMYQPKSDDERRRAWLLIQMADVGFLDIPEVVIKLAALETWIKDGTVSHLKSKPKTVVQLKSTD